MSVGTRPLIPEPRWQERLDPLRPSHRLPPALQQLRDHVLALHAGPGLGCAELAIADAEAWAARPAAGEDWLLWRARRTATRLRRMPLELRPGELVVGVPRLAIPTPAVKAAEEQARAVLGAVPPYPGGDAGHFHPDYEKLFRVGIGGLRAEVKARRAAAAADPAKTVFYDACDIALAGLADYIGRSAAACETMAADDPADAARWRDLAALCRRLTDAPPATFHEALQLMLFALLALWFGEDHHLTTPGRMDQTLRRFYEADRAAGRLDWAQALDLIACLYIQLNRILWPGSAISVMVGGRDATGQDVTNDLTYLCLAARLLTRLVYPTVGVAWHGGTPPELTRYGCRLLATGIGCPAFFHDELIAQGLRDHGVSPADSVNYMNSTCVEIKVCGASNMWVTQPYFNCPQALLDELAAVSRGERPAPATFEALQAAVRERLAATIRRAAADLDGVWRRRAEYGCFPLASCLIADCLERGVDYDRGGARYHWVENSFVGLANLADSLGAVQELVYRTRELTLAELWAVLVADWRGHEALQQRVRHTLPCYGNDQESADALAAAWARFLIQTTESCTIGGHRYVPGFFCWIMHERLGSQTGATPDGRPAGLPLADGAGAAQGRDRSGPTASVLSTTTWSHRACLGGLVHNAKFSRGVLRTRQGQEALRGVIETFLRRGGFEIQINAVSGDELRRAQRHPDEHRSLIVRVAGFSEYFVHLSRAMQDEVIARTEYELT